MNFAAKSTLQLEGGTADAKIVLGTFAEWKSTYKASRAIWIADRSMSGETTLEEWDHKLLMSEKIDSHGNMVEVCWNKGKNATDALKQIQSYEEVKAINATRSNYKPFFKNLSYG